MTTVRWHELVGRRVVGCDDEVIDHVVDIVARPVGDRMAISALLVGRRALLARIGQRRWLGARPLVEIAWEDVVELGDPIRVRVSRREVRGGAPA